MENILAHLRNYCYALLARREYSKKKITEKLRGKFPEASLEEINEVVLDLEQKNIISDQRFAEVFVRSKINSGWGKNKIKFNLVQKGIPKELIEAEMAKVVPDSEIILELVNRKFKKILESKPESYDEKMKNKQKIYRFLSSRGYGFEEFQSLVDEILPS